MAVIEGATRLQVLSGIACDRHLRSESVGRVAVMVDDHPEIFPVNYAVDERGDIFFRTDSGTKLNAAATAPTLAFEIDGFDEDRELGWSVLAVGPARWLVRPQDIAKVRSLPFKPWAAGEKANVVRLSPTKTTGRQISRRQRAGV
ncbi:MAG TPA: pyridoxamine 5'-phosphate oxidase family protein [Acidimicrobiales bacterium]|nr:pyridoxamine 5'-phosphate oxidase family protein [Acidimicrobiales bacterium]